MIRTNRKRRLVYPVTVNDLTAIAIRKWRRQLDVTQQDLADEIGLTRSHIANLETGRFRISLELLWDVAKVLGVEARRLIPTTEDLTSENRKAKRRKR